MTEVRNELVKKRYAAERRFKFYGAAALTLTALFLAALLVDVIIKGIPAFHETSVEIDVKVDPADVDPANLPGGNYDKMIKEAFRAEFPEVTGRAEKKALTGLLSTGGADSLRSMVTADPSIIGKTVTVPVLLGDDADLFLQGLLTEQKTVPGKATLHIARLGRSYPHQRLVVQTCREGATPPNRETHLVRTESHNHCVMCVGKLLALHDLRRVPLGTLAEEYVFQVLFRKLPPLLTPCRMVSIARASPPLLFPQRSEVNACETSKVHHQRAFCDTIFGNGNYTPLGPPRFMHTIS